MEAMAIGLAIDLLAGMLGSRIAPKERHVWTMVEMRAEIDATILAAHYDGPPIAFKVSEDADPRFRAWIDWDVMGNRFVVSLEPQQQAAKIKDLRRTMAHEVCHAVLDERLIKLGGYITLPDDKAREERHKVIRKCAEGVVKERKRMEKGKGGKR